MLTEKVITQNLKDRMCKVTEDLKDIISDLQKDNLVHTQEALDFIDNINMLSVAF